ncbi:hypothetical protein CHS0354_006273 [Potamilus streckersoni]|uniref:Uncharacterized protein n=1 Tax=Potamilus streckersoni TaxID=2493646 RepID=A0AAE0S4Z2_9BIVA|nr:hypothetical protein CHS0354_006273 [Potamilus streckersoni]
MFQFRENLVYGAMRWIDEVMRWSDEITIALSPHRIAPSPHRIAPSHCFIAPSPDEILHDGAIERLALTGFHIKATASSGDGGVIMVEASTAVMWSPAVGTGTTRSDLNWQ